MPQFGGNGYILLQWSLMPHSRALQVLYTYAIKTRI
jgi:hypothetical protein